MHPQEEMQARLKKAVCDLHRPWGQEACHAGPHGEALAWAEEEAAGVRGKPRFPGKERQGMVNSLGLAHLNHSSRLWAIAVVSRCQAHGLRMIKAEEQCLLGCKGQRGLAWMG